MWERIFCIFTSVTCPTNYCLTRFNGRAFRWKNEEGNWIYYGWRMSSPLCNHRQSLSAQCAAFNSLALNKNWIFIWRSTKLNHMLINFKNKVAINYFQVFTKVWAPVGVPFKASHYSSTLSEIESDAVSWRASVVRNRIRYMPWLGLALKTHSVQPRSLEVSCL